jgi:hypothetical protein
VYNGSDLVDYTVYFSERKAYNVLIDESNGAQGVVGIG